MGKILAFPRNLSPASSRGTVHVWPAHDGGYEIGHESASGNSWGSFDKFDDVAQAVSAAYRVNRDVYGDRCDVFLHPDVLAALPVTPDPVGGGF